MPDPGAGWRRLTAAERRELRDGDAAGIARAMGELSALADERGASYAIRGTGARVERLRWWPAALRTCRVCGAVLIGASAGDELCGPCDELTNPSDEAAKVSGDG